MRCQRKVSHQIAFSLAALVISGCGSAGDGGATVASIPGESSAADPSAAQPLATNHPVVVFTTSLGKITVELDRDRAPLTVDNFLSYAGQQSYDQTIFHQVERGFVARAGGFDTQLRAIPADFPIRNEADNGLKNLQGTIAMARPSDSIDSATTQFFFNLADNESLDYRQGGLEDYGYCVFGKVSGGLDVLERIGNVAVEDAPELPKMPQEKVIIESVRRVR